MKNRKGNLLMTLGLVLILAALALVGYNQWDASRAQQESAVVLVAGEDALDQYFRFAFSGRWNRSKPLHRP